MDPLESTAVERSDIFASTHWSVVLQAATSDEERSLEALQRLCETYWPPVYAFIRRKGFGREDSEELTLMEGEWLKSVHQNRGRFRAFLLASLKNFLANEWDRRKAQKRGGNRQIISLEEAAAESWYEAKADESPDRVFERRWVATLLETVLARLGRECEQTGQREQFEALKPCLMGENAPISYREIGARLRLSEGALKVAAYRLRRRYGAALRAEIRQTVDSEKEVEEEIRYLFKIFE
jgi:DNA-directed RNA polymerase specialized sigma24 family protein